MTIVSMAEQGPAADQTLQGRLAAAEAEVRDLRARLAAKDAELAEAHAASEVPARHPPQPPADAFAGGEGDLQGVAAASAQDGAQRAAIYGPSLISAPGQEFFRELVTTLKDTQRAQTSSLDAIETHCEWEKEKQLITGKPRTRRHWHERLLTELSRPPDDKKYSLVPSFGTEKLFSAMCVRDGPEVWTKSGEQIIRAHRYFHSLMEKQHHISADAGELAPTQVRDFHHRLRDVVQRFEDLLRNGLPAEDAEGLLEDFTDHLNVACVRDLHYDPRDAWTALQHKIQRSLLRLASGKSSATASPHRGGAPSPKRAKGAKLKPFHRGWPQKQASLATGEPYCHGWQRGHCRFGAACKFEHRCAYAGCDGEHQRGGPGCIHPSAGPAGPGK